VWGVKIGSLEQHDPHLPIGTDGIIAGALLLHGPSGVVMYESLLRLAEELKTILPQGLDCFFVANSGTEAVEGVRELSNRFQPSFLFPLFPVSASYD